jgi:hypothetical protein
MAATAGKLTTLALALVLAIAAPAAAAEPDPLPALGINVNRVMNDAFDTDRWDFHLGLVAADGIHLSRTDAFWQDAESNPPQNGVHTYDWAMSDFRARSLVRNGQRWLPVLDYSARWASSDPGGSEHAPPVDNADYAAFAAGFARRYGRGGSYWAEHPELPRLPVTTYEIWNEPNLGWFWQPAPDAARYADMYVRARAAIRAVDPAATVVVGGLLADGADDYVRAMYAARPDLRGNVDGLGLHPYSRTAAGVLQRVRSMRATLASLGDGGVPLYLTEFGWVTSGDGSAVRATEDQRAARLAEVTEALVRSDCGVATVIPYTWTTPESNPADPEDWYGLVHPDGGRTPSSDAFRGVVQRLAADPPDPFAPRRICGPEVAPPLDTDGDGVPDTADADDDGDGVADVADAFPLDAGESADTDRDGTGDNADPDDDGDGLADAADAFPLDAAETVDADRDGVGDNADPDDDGDGLPDIVEAARGSSSLDGDSDDDGIGDRAERRTSPIRADSDGDGLPDGLELGLTAGVPDPPGPVAGTDPRRFRPDRQPRSRTRATARDSDGDGLADGREDRNGNGRRDRAETDPYARDTDRDGVSDRRDRRPLDRRRR